MVKPISAANKSIEPQLVHLMLKERNVESTSFSLIFMIPFIHEKPSVNGTDIGYSVFPFADVVSDGLSYTAYNGRFITSPSLLKL